MRDRFQWARLLAFVTGLVNQELLLRNEYLAAENRVLRAHLPSRLQLSDPERPTPGRDCQTTRTQSPEGYRVRCQAGHYSRLVSAPGRTEVRRFPAA